MAIRKGNFLIGKLKNHAYRKVKEKQIVQTAPGKGNVKQTADTKKVAYLFGRASMLGKFVRHMAEEQIFGFHDGPMVNRLTKTLQQILLQYYPVGNETHHFKEDSFATLKGFDFNIDSPMSKSLWAEPVSSLSGLELKVTLPEINIAEEIKFPKDCEHCIITLGTKYFDLEKGYIRLSLDSRKIEVNKNQVKLEAQDYNFQLPEGCLCLTSISIQYFHQKHQLTVLYNHKLFNPAQICNAVVTPGTFVYHQQNKWKETNWSKAAFDKYATINQALLH